MCVCWRIGLWASSGLKLNRAWGNGGGVLGWTGIVPDCSRWDSLFENDTLSPRNGRILFQSRSFRKIPNRLFEIYRARVSREKSVSFLLWEIKNGEMGEFVFFYKVVIIWTVIILLIKSQLFERSFFEVFAAAAAGRGPLIRGLRRHGRRPRSVDPRSFTAAAGSGKLWKFVNVYNIFMNKC